MSTGPGNSMSINALFAAPPALWPEFEPALMAAFAKAGLNVALSQTHSPADVDYLIFGPGGPVTDFRPFTRARAGVEKIITNPSLTIPLTRMVDPGLTQGMVEYVTGHVLRHHLGMDTDILVQPGHWDQRSTPLAQDRLVTVLGLGALGQACAQMLAQIGFAVTGWSQSPKHIPGLRCLSGPDGLTTALRGAQIVVTLLPLTVQTDCILNADTMSMLATGAMLINPGRGGLIDDAALLTALDTGQIGHATLDVFRTEPLPPDHRFWTHPGITVTPHIAADTRPATSATVIAENIRRGQAGEPWLYLVDRAKGY
jgi:glyoxylate/hydroxypyruvate reductase